MFTYRSTYDTMGYVDVKVYNNKQNEIIIITIIIIIIIIINKRKKGNRRLYSTYSLSVLTG